MKLLLTAFVLPASALTVGATITVSIIYAVAAVVLGIAILLFVLLLCRGIAIRVKWGKKKKKISFERIRSQEECPELDSNQRPIP